MKYTLLLLSILFTIVLCHGDHSSHKPEDPTPGIVDVTSTNVNDVITITKNALVEFYAPWCGHCKNLAPEMAVLGEVLLKGKPTDTVVGKVDCTKEQSICTKYGVNGYPTIKFFRKGKEQPEDYQGGRSADDFIEYLNKNAGTRLKSQKPEEAVHNLTPSNFDKIALDPTKDVLVEFYAPWCGHCKQLAPIYEKVGKAFALEKNCIVAKVNADDHKELASRFGIQGYPTLKFFSKTDKKGSDAQRFDNPKGFVEYLNQKCGTFRDENGRLTKEAGTKSELNQLASKFASASNEERNKIIEEAKKIEGNDFYVRVMKTILDKGMAYVSSESLRLNKMLENENVKPEQKDSFNLRLNVLSQFE